MTLQWLIASLHLVALLVGAASVFSRGVLLKRIKDPSQLAPVFMSDNLWGLSGILFLATGVWRAFFGLEKDTDYYLSNPLFHAKMGLFILIILLEIKPARTLVRWRRTRGAEIDLGPAETLARVSHVQLGIITVMIFLAAGMARGLGASGG